MAKSTRKAKRVAELRAKTKSELVELIEGLDERVFELDELQHQRCMEWRQSIENHKNDPSLVKNLVKEWTVHLNRFGIGVRLKEDNYFTFVKDDVEVRLLFTVLFRVGINHVLDMFNIPKNVIAKNDAEGNGSYHEGLKGKTCTEY